jgi:hypothetical protein
VVVGANGDRGTRCLPDRHVECGYGTVEVECGINRLVCIESTVEVCAKQSPICLEIIVLYTWGVGRWLEEGFERYGIVIGGKCGDCFRFR